MQSSMPLTQKCFYCKEPLTHWSKRTLDFHFKFRTATCQDPTKRRLPWSPQSNCSGQGQSGPPRHSQTRSWRQRPSWRKWGRDPQSGDTAPEAAAASGDVPQSLPAVFATWGQSCKAKVKCGKSFWKLFGVGGWVGGRWWKPDFWNCTEWVKLQDNSMMRSQPWSTHKNVMASNTLKSLCEK